MFTLARFCLCRINSSKCYCMKAPQDDKLHLRWHLTLQSYRTSTKIVQPADARPIARHSHYAGRRCYRCWSRRSQCRSSSPAVQIKTFRPGQPRPRKSRTWSLRESFDLMTARSTSISTAFAAPLQACCVASTLNLCSGF